MSSRFEYSRVPDLNESPQKSSKGTLSRHTAGVGLFLALVFFIFGRYHNGFLPKLRYYSSRGQVEIIQTSLKTEDRLTSLDLSGLSNRGIRVSEVGFGNKFAINPSAGIGQILLDSSQRYQVKCFPISMYAVDDNP
jgi:hypothetical protein